MAAVDFADIQGLARFGHGKLREAEFLLLEVADAGRRGRVARAAPVTTAEMLDAPPRSALQVALTAAGLRALGLDEAVVAQFPQPFLPKWQARRAARVASATSERTLRKTGTGVARTPRPPDALRRNRRPRGPQGRRPGWRLRAGLPAWSAPSYRVARGVEPFGFVDGVSEPVIDWDQQLHHRRCTAGSTTPTCSRRASSCSATRTSIRRSRRGRWPTPPPARRAVDPPAAEFGRTALPRAAPAAPGRARLLAAISTASPAATPGGASGSPRRWWAATATAAG